MCDQTPGFYYPLCKKTCNNCNGKPCNESGQTLLNWKSILFKVVLVEIRLQNVAVLIQEWIDVLSRKLGGIVQLRAIYVIKFNSSPVPSTAQRNVLMITLTQFPLCNVVKQTVITHLETFIQDVVKLAIIAMVGVYYNCLLIINYIILLYLN